jgi:hypothetical protein
MSQATTKKAQHRRKVKYPNIGVDAAALDVTRQHLWEVLQGNRPSRSLLRRYRALKKETPGGGR